MEMMLRIHMGDLTHRLEPLPPAYGLLGGRALTSRILCDEVDPTCDARGPNNKLVLAPV
ncbi:MAG TPA: aldehyde ferredoxin oxidoreductase N-terminal domain-containing protein [Symbiobacteriaceae bacterium]|nr:aldehyde ferredoxin oxidoreductase N-terminal domain-containing protein [Symbiobacteriaceae bacterium]